MKSKDLRMALLMDYYGAMLTDKQREVMELYYDEDLSLAEIAEHAHITRQGVRDSIKRGEAYILELEEKLGLADRMALLEETIGELSEHLSHIRQLNIDSYFSRPIEETVATALETAEKALK
ncbi:MAG: YlxM family DNA-binding protein [Bacillota bacterium]|nr:YlxM family DNA-binding protein [Bacillota bacterium]